MNVACVEVDGRGLRFTAVVVYTYACQRHVGQSVWRPVEYGDKPHIPWESTVPPERLDVSAVLPPAGVPAGLPCASLARGSWLPATPQGRGDSSGGSRPPRPSSQSGKVGRSRGDSLGAKPERPPENVPDRGWGHQPTGNVLAMPPNSRQLQVRGTSARWACTHAPNLECGRPAPCGECRSRRLAAPLPSPTSTSPALANWARGSPAGPFPLAVVPGRAQAHRSPAPILAVTPPE